MKIKKNDFSFEDSLKYLENLAFETGEGMDIQEFHHMNEDELPLDKVIKVYGVAMNVKVIKKYSYPRKSNDYIFFGAMSQILDLIESMDSLRHVEMQTDGSILALFDTPMKQDVEDIINLSAQVRSINDVVLKKFYLDLSEQVVSVGIDYGSISYFSSAKSQTGPIYYGTCIKFAKMLADTKEDSINISNDIFINLGEDMQKSLFTNYDMISSDLKYYYSKLINLRMNDWVKEQK